jgi:hypothetical protein
VKILSLLLLTTWLQGASFTSFDSEADIENMILFLTSTSDSVGVCYQACAGDLAKRTLPLSCYSTADFWGQYIATLPGNDCTVTNVYCPKEGTLRPLESSPGADLQIERVIASNGLDIHDGAVWQIALALAANTGIKSLSSDALFSLIENQNQLLLSAHSGDNSNEINRATFLSNPTFTYNNIAISQSPFTYFFNILPRNWLATDPFWGTSYQEYITTTDLPKDSDYQPGTITWPDCDPVTGNNSWALLIGPLQAAYLQYVINKENTYVPHTLTAIQNALPLLYPLRCMQVPMGGIYSLAQKDLSNCERKAVISYEISVTENAAALAGLLIFQQILQQEIDNDPSLGMPDLSTLQTSVYNISAAIYGGATPEGIQNGLLSFFQNYAWDAKNGVFYRGGLANDPCTGAEWNPTQEPKAVDANVLTVTVLGQPLIDSWFGFGTAYQIWQSVKTWAAFFGPDQKLWGVGYSDEDGNGSDADYANGILSTESTAAALNMIRALIVQYELATDSSDYTSDQQTLAGQYVKDLSSDEASIVSHLGSLRSDQYLAEEAFSTVCPDNYSKLIPFPTGRLSYLYASKRYLTPFGSFVNPLPSTASTSWAIMLHYQFNPLGLGGSYQPYSWQQ